MNGVTVMLKTLADKIQALEFDTVFSIEDGAVVERHDLYAPSVYNDPDNDIYLDDSRWDCFTGLSGQYGYNGAVMHSSELFGVNLALYLLDYAQQCDDVVFSLVVVNDLDDEDAVGWAIAYRELAN
jgi:hypothetical protein